MKNRVLLRVCLVALVFFVLESCSNKVSLRSLPNRTSALEVLDLNLPVVDIETKLSRGDLSAEELTRAALGRIAEQDGSLHAIIATNPYALAAARASDEARRVGKDLGPLMGIPILIKDNVETRDEMATTAGSLALKNNITHRDSPLVARLRAGGAIILGKANLSEWANIRSTHAISGWSGVGGLVANPHDHNRTACGSSSGSGAGVAAHYAPLAIGTETDGSVTCPSSMNGLVGLKPTLGLVSRTYVVPISHSQDTPGPMGHSVADVAALLSVIAGSDPLDKATAEADAHKTDYSQGLTAFSLKGVRIGVLRDVSSDAKTNVVFEHALKALSGAGAVLVDIKDSSVKGLGDAENVVLMTELKADLNKYLSSTPVSVKTRSLSDVIAFDKANVDKEMPYFQQELFDKAQATKGLKDPVYMKAQAMAKASSSAMIDGLLAKNKVSFLIAPTYGPAWLSDKIYGDQYNGPSATTLPATAGYPHLTVPMGEVQGLPVGLSFIGTKWSDAELLKAGFAFERARDVADKVSTQQH